MSDKQDLCCGNDCHSEASQEVASPQEQSEVKVRPYYTSHYDDEAWEVSVTLPGVAKDQVTVSIENEILEIEAKRTVSVPEGWRPLGEYPATRHYQLRLDVGPEVDPGKVTASQEDGVLTLRLPLKETVKPRTIEVS